MIETALRAFTTFFATVSPIDVAALFAAITASATTGQRRRMAIKGTLIATVILLIFIIFGKDILNWIGITLPALRTAGGILLLLLGIDMVLARHSGMATTTVAETAEAEAKADISVFPLATPLIAGPGAMSAAVLLASETEGKPMLLVVVVLAMLIVMVITLALLLIAGQLPRFIGVTAQNVITRVVGVLLSAFAVQFIFDGVSTSGIF
jgi:multiple antibiotic resistance protein